MSGQDSTLLLPRVRGDWVRLRTLTVLRWIAVTGQITAIFVAILVFRLDLSLGLILVAVGASVAANLVAILVYPRNTRLSENELLGMLLFDAAQLSALLALAGGLNNPFALLLLVPVTISATRAQAAFHGVAGRGGDINDFACGRLAYSPAHDGGDGAANATVVCLGVLGGLLSSA